MDKNNFIVSLGNTSLFNTYQNLMPDSSIKDKEQAYFINQLQEAPNIVFFGVATTKEFTMQPLLSIQLLDEKEFLFHSAVIIDYPDFVQRGFLLHEYGGTLTEMKRIFNIFPNTN